MQRDDQVLGQPCDNISAKNKNYNELTAIYWAWKNIKRLYPGLEYIGLCHYRRFFDFANSFPLADATIVKPISEVVNYKLDKKSLERILSKYDIVMAEPLFFRTNLQEQYCVHHISDDFRTLCKVVDDLYSEDSYCFYKTMYMNNAFSGYNMTVMKWDLFEQYCTWLFGILEECERRISRYNNNQARVFGFMAERLFNVWKAKQKERGTKIKYVPIILFKGESAPHIRLPLIRRVISRIRMRLVMFLLCPLRKSTVKQRFNDYLKRLCSTK